MSFTILSAVTPDYEERLRLTSKTWSLKNQFSDKPLVLFTHGFRRPQRRFRDLWKDIKVIDWNMDSYDSQRELMVSSFVLGVKYIETEFSVKVDCDSYFINDEDVFSNKDFDYDLVSNKWGYTKPVWFIEKLEKWSRLNNIPGKELFPSEIFSSHESRFCHKRIASFICLQKTSFVKECVSYLDEERLPVPSHDTFLWYMAERLPTSKWTAHKLKRRGCDTRGTFGRIRRELEKYDLC